MHALRRIPKSLYIMTGCLVALGYFMYHSEHGNYGFRAAEQINDRLAALEAEYATLEERRDHLETLVNLLRPESLDPDMLDERIRANLSFAHPRELVILHSN